MDSPGDVRNGGTRWRLIIVDDEEMILTAMKRYFSKLGFEVVCAREYEEAQALLSHERFDVLIEDLRLTGTHGAEGLDMVDFTRERCPATRIVLMTGYGSADVEAEARRRGADAFVSKPIPLPELAQTVRLLMERPRE